MPTAENAKIQYEAGQTTTAMSALTNSGDATTYTSAASQWSQKSGYAPVVRPNGIITGGTVIPAASATNDAVDTSAITSYINGSSVSGSASTDDTITRPATDVAKVNSITLTDAGAIAVVAGTDGGSTTFSETRAAAGGPPLIPVTSIEIAQVRVTTNAAAVITAAQIFAVVGTHTERYDYPLWTTAYISGSITFVAALPSIHTGPLPKAVHASYAAPIFADIQNGTDFVPPANSHSVSSTQIYGGTIGATASSLGQGSFTAYLQDGATDPLVSLKDSILWFKFFPDRYKTPYVLCQGKLGMARSFPSGDSITAECTISAEAIGAEYAA